MKKLFVLLIAAAMFAAPRASAQDVFNHMSLGVTFGIKGVGIEMATPMGDHFQARLGYAIFPYTYSNKFDFGSAKIGETTRDLNNIPITASPWAGGNANLFFDYFPGKGPFHLTAGLVVGTGRFLKAEADLRKPLNADEYGTLAVGFENGAVISTDKNGFAQLDAKVNSVMPYVGIGFGHAVLDQTATVTFDLGVAFTGGIDLQSYNYVKNTMSANNPVEVVPITSKSVNNKDNGLIDKICGIPVFPMAKLGIFFKLF